MKIVDYRKDNEPRLTLGEVDEGQVVCYKGMPCIVTEGSLIDLTDGQIYGQFDAIDWEQPAIVLDAELIIRGEIQ